MLSTAGGGKTNVIGKMNNAKNAMRQKQGGGSKKGGEALHKRHGQARHSGASTSEPKSSPNARPSGEARAPGGWKPALLLGRAGVGNSGATAGAAHVHRRFPPERWNRDDDPAPVTGGRKRASGPAPFKLV
jgi:hypothetical protein